MAAWIQQNGDQDGTTDGGKSGPIFFKGRMGLWHPAKANHLASFSLLNGDSVKVGGESLTATEPTTFEFQGRTVRTTIGNNQTK